MIKNLMAALILLFCGSVCGVFAQEQEAHSQTQSQPRPEMGVGLAFGSFFEMHQKAEFSAGNGTYFQIRFQEPDGTLIYFQNEQSSFNVTVGDATALGSQTLHGIGSLMPLGLGLNFDVMIGGATLQLPAATSASGGAEQITGASSTSSIAQLGLKWSRQTGLAKLACGFAYRVNRLGQSVLLTNSQGQVASLTDKSAMQLSIEIAHSF